MIDKIKKIIGDFSHLIFPEICCGCNNYLVKGEKHVCKKCFYDFPKTNYHHQRENPVSQLFWGRTNIEAACSIYHYQKGGKLQNLIFALKYKNKKEIGHLLGNKIGQMLKESEIYSQVNYIIPVPLHINKLKKRGYNQSEIIAQGIAEYLNIQIDNKSLTKIIHNNSQTRKSRLQRWHNVQEAYKLTNSQKLKNQHIILLDDIITTGATIESCITELQKTEGIKIYVVTIAKA